MKTLCMVLTTVGILVPTVATSVNKRAADQPHKKECERAFTILVDDMERTCKLSEGQVRRLKVAAKGAIAAATEKLDAPQLSEEDQELQKGARISWADVVGDAEVEVKLGNNVFVGRYEINSQAVKKEPRWANAIKQVLTKQQSQKYDSAVKQRQARARKAAVAVFIARVDRELLLSDEQRMKLTKLIDQEFGAAMAADLSWFEYHAFAGEAARMPVDQTKFKSLLTKPQFVQWKRSYETELQSLWGRQRKVAPTRRTTLDGDCGRLSPSRE